MEGEAGAGRQQPGPGAVPSLIGVPGGGGGSEAGAGWEDLHVSGQSEVGGGGGNGELSVVVQV